jgi:hypothetical protein
VTGDNSLVFNKSSVTVTVKVKVSPILSLIFYYIQQNVSWYEDIMVLASQSKSNITHYAKTCVPIGYMERNYTNESVLYIRTPVV